MVSELTDPATETSRRGGKAAITRDLWWWAPGLIALAYLITLAVQFNQLLAVTYLNADAASAPVIGEEFGATAGHPLVILGHLGWYSTLLFELGTRWMPLHRQIWEAAPYAMALSSAALVGWGAWRTAGRWAGAMAAAIMICASPATLSLLLALNDHAPTWFTLALLGAFVVLLEQRADTLAGARLGAMAIVVGALLGANAASDILLTVAGAVPFLLAVGGTWALHPSRSTARAGVFALATGAVAIAIGVLVHAVMHHENIVAAVDPKRDLLVGADAVGTNFKLWWQAIAVLGNGNFFGQAIGFSTVLALACAALTIAAVLLAVRVGRGEVAAALTTRRRDPKQLRQNAQLAWCLFWSSSLLLLSASFIVSGIPEDLTSNRYLVGVIYAAAALVPLLGSRSALTRAVLTAGVTIYAFTGWLGLAQQRLVDSATSPTDRLASAVATIAHREHLTVGYAGYWDAAPITWATHLRVKAFPVVDCDNNQHLCAAELHLITSWYSPRPGAKTFLLSDPAYPAVPSAPTADLGNPIAVHQIGTVTMYVYPYDIAAHLFAL